MGNNYPEPNKAFELSNEHFCQSLVEAGADDWLMMNEIKVVYGSETCHVVDESASFCIHPCLIKLSPNTINGKEGQRMSDVQQIPEH